MRCDLCGNDKYEVIWDKIKRDEKKILKCSVIRDKDGKIVHGINVICTTCGLLQVLDKMSEYELSEFYKKQYREIYNKADASTEMHCANSLMILKKILDREKKESLLDIGCYTGKFVKILNEVELIKAQGIDYNTTAENCFSGNFMDFEFEKKYQVITTFNCLEHMHSPTKTLKKIHELLDENGILFLSVPNLVNKNINCYPDAWLSNAHLYHFNINTLHAYFEKCGFRFKHLTILTESIGTKIYAAAIKSTPKTPLYIPPDVDAYIEYFESMNRMCDSILKIF